MRFCFLSGFPNINVISLDLKYKINFNMGYSKFNCYIVPREYVVETFIIILSNTAKFLKINELYRLLISNDKCGQCVRNNMYY
jgi:hypothetical protein